ncbi:MAG: fluoride efflux transporter CrcB [Alphaproteobacteria bacterium]|nr:fluoride efflux transporter CrcB [Alphaproteobacteria bacterium]
MFVTMLQVAAGGAIGASGRYLSGVALIRFLGSNFPYGTMFVNVIGSFLMGFFAIYLLERMDGSFTRYAPFLMTGLLGGFTTFSAYSLDALYLIERGRYMAATLYMGGSVLVALLGLFIGMSLARTLA